MLLVTDLARYLLSKGEVAYLSGSKELTSKQRRDIRYRLNKKLKFEGDGGGAEGQDLNARSPTDSSMAATQEAVQPPPAKSLDMAGIRSSNLRRPTFLSLTPVGSSKLLGPSQNFGAASQFWQQFLQYLSQQRVMAPKTAEDRLRYVKRYAMVLQTGDASSLLQVAPNKRIHIMKALSSLARYTGTQSDWLTIRQRYGLQWSTGTEKLDAFTRFFDDSRDLDTMMQWLREAISTLPNDYANFFLFCTLTGMRASECLEAVRLLRTQGAESYYYNPEQQVLQHYRYPEIFIRRTKAIYISVVDDSIVSIARKIRKVPGYNGLKMVSRRTSVSMRVKYCRKIFASHLHRCGISDSLVDMLQGRIVLS
jgi:hypothetical protein